MEGLCFGGGCTWGTKLVDVIDGERSEINFSFCTNNIYQINVRTKAS